MARLIVALALLFAGSVSAFSPSFVKTQRSVVMSAEMSRRNMLGSAAAAVVGLSVAGAPALADGAVSATTVARSRGIYGGRIAALSGAVEKGDFAAILEEKNSFILFCSGAYSQTGKAIKENKAKAVAASTALLAAAEAGNAAGVKAAYKDFLAVAGISAKDYDEKTKEYTQGYSSEFDWKARTDKGTIYIR
jgi:hypothetical protein